MHLYGNICWFSKKIFWKCSQNYFLIFWHFWTREAIVYICWNFHNHIIFPSYIFSHLIFVRLFLPFYISIVLCPYYCLKWWFEFISKNIYQKNVNVLQQLRGHIKETSKYICQKIIYQKKICLCFHTEVEFTSKYIYQKNIFKKMFVKKIFI